MRNFSLIRCICCIPSRVLQKISLNNWRCDCRVISSSNVAFIEFIFPNNTSKFLEVLMLRHRLSDSIVFKSRNISNLLRNRLMDQFLDRFYSQILKHFLCLLLIWSYVSRKLYKWLSTSISEGLRLAFDDNILVWIRQSGEEISLAILLIMSNEIISTESFIWS